MINWSKVLLVIWVVLFLALGGRVEGYLFPASSQITVTRLIATNTINLSPDKTDFISEGPYSAFWVEFYKKRDNPPYFYCNPLRLEWWHGQRGYKASKIEAYSWGESMVRKGGLNFAGPWTLAIHPSQFSQTYADVIHRCYTFGIPHVWETKTRLWN